SRAADQGRGDRRRHAAEGRVLAAGPGRRRPEGAHHRRPRAPRDPPRGAHHGGDRDRDHPVKRTPSPTAIAGGPSTAPSDRQKGHAVDTKQLMEWSDKHLMTFAKRIPVALVRGEGVRVWDSDGKEYLDFTGGIAVTALGHSHPKVVGTMQEQAATLLHVSNYFHIPQQIELAKLLCEHSFADRVFFSNSGAEANETAIKLARKWAKEHG